MKKINVTIILAALLALHAFIFTALLRDEPASPTPLPSPTPPDTHAAVTNDPLLQLLPELKLDLSPPSAPASSPVSPLPRTTTVLDRPGTLQTDRPDRRTAQNFGTLTQAPYRGAIVVDGDTGRILFQERADAFAYPASVTKMMTLLLVLEEAEAGRIALHDHVEITDEVAQIGGSQIWLDPRETHFTVDDLIYALMVHSANDAARALALHVDGNLEAFVTRMNRRARELGMNATIYRSDHGLPPSDGSQPDISTPYDIALLSMALLQRPETLRYTGTELKYLRDGDTMLATRNALAKRVDGYAGCDGLKTGYHARGGWSLAATAERDGRRVLAVLLGCPDKQTRNAEARKLLDRGFAAQAN